MPTPTDSDVDRAGLIAECAHAGRKFIDKFGLTLVPGDNLADPYVNAGMPNALLIWEGADEIGGDGYDFQEAHGLGSPNPNYGEWPYLMDWFYSYDPKNNPPEGDDTMERLFLGIRLCRVEGEIYLGFYLTVADAKGDATRHD